MSGSDDKVWEAMTDEQDCVVDTEEEEELEGKPRSLLFSLLKSVRKGQDLMRVPIPAEFIEARSLLEKYTDMLAHPEFLLEAPMVENPVERFVSLIRWYLSGWHVRPGGVKKPFNPLLGEFFQCFWVDKDKNKSFFIGEQVSHHPPVSAMYFDCKDKFIVANGHLHTKSKFFGNSAGSLMEGFLNIWFINRPGEKYKIMIPNVYACGLILGKLRMELGGTCLITCESTNLEAEIDFKGKPFFGGKYNGIGGKLYNLDDKKKKPLYEFGGYWDSQITYKSPEMGENILFDATTATKTPKRVRPIKDQDQWESRKVWEQACDAIKQKDADEANKHKLANEEAQRARAKEREETGTSHQQKFFTWSDEMETWVYNNLNLSRENGLEKKMAGAKI